MKEKLSISKPIFIMLFASTYSLTVSAQTKFSYLTVEFNNPYKDSIDFSMDLNGLDSIIKAMLEPYVTRRIKVKTENELFNALGKVGWELITILDMPNKITQVRDHYSGQPIVGSYNLYRDGVFSKRKIYFKVQTK